MPRFDDSEQPVQFSTAPMKRFDRLVLDAVESGARSPSAIHRWLGTRLVWATPRRIYAALWRLQDAGLITRTPLLTDRREVVRPHWFWWLTGGRPMIRISGLFVDRVNRQLVSHYRDRLGRDWHAQSPWAWFRVRKDSLYLYHPKPTGETHASD
jgi:hypothetical protein